MVGVGEGREAGGLGRGVEWVEIVEPRSGEHMYANLTTGECAWEPPLGVAVKPTDAAQWWELFDPNTQRFYYYNAASQTTVWHRPPNSDIIPLAKLQTLKQNTEAVRERGEFYDVPRSPSTSSTHSTPSQQSREVPRGDAASPLADPRTAALRSLSTATTQTQTSPSASPRAHKKHHHHRRSGRSSDAGRSDRSDGRHEPPAQRNPLQETLDRQIATMSSSRRGLRPEAPPLSPSSLGDPSEALLKLKTDEITAEVERFFEANQERLPKFPTDGRASANSFARSFADSESALPPPLPPHGGKDSPIMALRQAATLDRARVKGREARVVPTRRPSGGSESSRDSTPNNNGPRRQRSLDLPSAVRGAPLSTPSQGQGGLPGSPLRQRKPLSPAASVKEAQITTVAGSPKLWGSKAARQRTTPDDANNLWAPRSELAMIKSLDSGIRSAESTSDRIPGGSPQPHASDQASSSMEPSPRLPADPQGSVSAPSPKPKPRLSIKGSSTTNVGRKSPGYGSFKGRGGDPGMVSLAKTYQPFGHQLQFSQQHQQFILGDDGNFRPNTTVDSSEDEKEAGEEDELFADDEDFGELSPAHSALLLSSAEELRRGDPARGSGSSRGKGPSLSAHSAHHHPHPVGYGHYHPPPLQHNVSADNGKRRSNGSTEAGRVFPGDATPPLHRPASMVVGGPGAADARELPPNTATLSRAMKRGADSRGAGVSGGGGESWEWAGVGVSRSASSLTRTHHLSSTASQGQPDPDQGLPINCHKKGLFGKRQSLQSMMTWSRDTLKKPLIMTNAKEVKKEACGVFKRIQAYMGDRKVKAGVSTDQLALDLVQRGWVHPALRDEIYIQIAKQTTENPRTESLRRGWELLGICLAVFPPSPALFSFLEAHVSRNSDPVLDPPEVPVSHYAAHAAKKLERAAAEMATPGGTGGGSKRGLRKPTLQEVEEARIHIFNPSMFGNSLEEVMANQRDKFPLRQLPWIQTTLSEMVLQLNGAQTEGIFRVPGDMDEVNSLKLRVDRWLVPGVPDPHVPASLLKLWYRELAAPLIPAQLYEDAVGSGEDVARAAGLLDRLPRLNRLVLAYLIRFLQVMARPENAAQTKMDAANLAMVFAPNVLRCASDDPRLIFENTRKEMLFIRTLISHYDTSFMEGLQ